MKRTKISESELKEIMEQHDLWWRTKEKEGKQAYLRRRDLSGLDLSGYMLSKADIKQADLRETNLSYARLGGALLAESDLSRAVLKEANLDSAHCFRASFNHANLSGAQLRAANLRNTIFFKTSLQGANLKSATLISADLAQADLRRADIRRAKLDRARLVKANLTEADLRESNLCLADLSGACLTGAKIWEIQRADWHIRNVDCRFVFIDVDGAQRVPKDRDFVANEFVETYGSFPTVEYFFEKGFGPLDPVLITKVISMINEEHADIGLELDSLFARGLHPSAKFRVTSKEVTESAIRLLAAKYEDLKKRVSNSAVTLTISSEGGVMQIGEIKIGGSVHGIIGDNGTIIHSTVQTISITKEQASSLATALDSLPAESSLSGQMLNVVKDQLKKFASGEIAAISQQAMQWLKESAASLDLPTLTFRIGDLFR